MIIKGIACDNTTEFEQELSQITFFEVNTKGFHGWRLDCTMPNGESFSMDIENVKSIASTPPREEKV